MSLNNLIKSTFQTLGFDISRRTVSSNAELRLFKILFDNNISLVYDIGANEGQFAQILIDNSYRGRIVSFEPLTSAHELLKTNAMKFDNWIVESRCALGDFVGESIINISASTASSSLLIMAKSHVDAAPNTVMVSNETVSVLTMDSFFSKYECNNNRLFLKIDTQGFEYQVLKGGMNTLNYVKVLQLELSIVELYEGQKLMRDVLDYVENIGFKLWGLEPAFVDRNTAQMLQVDAIFVKHE